ncbi:UNVERIFIED_ORG: hypothetical protein J2W85_001178 [Ensifer adhaerens]|nr:hypothetical protein [Ensifer adhaerens]
MAQNIKTISADDFEAVAATVQRYVDGRRTQHNNTSIALEVKSMPLANCRGNGITPRSSVSSFPLWSAT